MTSKLVVGAVAAMVAAFGVVATAVDAEAQSQAKVTIAKGVFYRGVGPTQYLARARLIGQPVVDKAGAKLGEVDDIILGTKDDKIDGVVLNVSGKRIGVRWSAIRVQTKDGKTTISLPAATMEMLRVLPPYQATFKPAPAKK